MVCSKGAQTGKMALFLAATVSIVMKERWLLIVIVVSAERRHLFVCSPSPREYSPYSIETSPPCQHLLDTERIIDAQQSRDDSNNEPQEDETNDERYLLLFLLRLRQETTDGRDALRVRVDKVELASRKLRDTRQVIWIPAVPLELFLANSGALQRRVNLVSRPIDRGTLQGLAKVCVSRGCVGHEATDGISEHLVD